MLDSNTVLILNQCELLITQQGMCNWLPLHKSQASLSPQFAVLKMTCQLHLKFSLDINATPKCLTGAMRNSG